ncbi:MAG: hypothetical protein ACTSXH_09155 [Promethearchaeota archaeon]
MNENLFPIEDVQEENLLQDLLHYNITKYEGIFEFIKSILEKARIFYHDVDFFSTQALKKSSEISHELYNKNLPNYGVFFLSEESYEIYQKIHKIYKKQLKELIEKDAQKEPRPKRPYIVINMDFPIEEIIKYDRKSKKFNKLFEVFD